MLLLLSWPRDGGCWCFVGIFPLLRFGSWAGGSFQECLRGPGELSKVLWRACSRGQPLPSAAACLVPRHCPAQGTPAHAQAAPWLWKSLVTAPARPCWLCRWCSAGFSQWDSAVPTATLGDRVTHAASTGQDAVLQKKPWDPSGEHDSAMCLGISSAFKTWIESCKGPPSRWEAGIQDIQGEAEAAGFAQPADEMLQRELSAVCCYLMGGCGEDLSTHFPRCPVEGWKAERQLNTHCNMGNSVQMVGKNCSPREWSNTEEGCPEKFWSLQLWRY